jgi:hypothetical protein
MMPEWTGTLEELEDEMLDSIQHQSQLDLEQEQVDYYFTDPYVKTMVDMVNSPAHYTAGGIETIDVIKAKLTPEEFRGYLKGNALKYLLRANYKGKHDQDVHKADWYIEELSNVTPRA